MRVHSLLGDVCGPSKLWQYTGSRVEHRDRFSSCNRLTIKAKMVNSIWILRFCKNSEVLW